MNIVSESNIEIIEHRSGYKSKAKSYSYVEYKFQVDEESILKTEIPINLKINDVRSIINITQWKVKSKYYL